MLILSFPTVSLGQTKGNESKYNSISKRGLKQDQTATELLQDARRIMANDVTGALDKVEEALAISITQQDKLNEVRCYLLLGNINEKLGEWELVINNYSNAYRMLKDEFTTEPEFIEALTGLRNAYAQIGSNEEAIRFSRFKLLVVKSEEDIAETHLDIADLLFGQTRYDSSLLELNLAETIIDEFNLNLLKREAQRIRAKILAQGNDLETAENLYQISQIAGIESYESFSEKEELSIENTKEALITAYNREERVENEIILRNQSIASNTAKGKPLKVSKEKQVLSKVFIEIGNTAAAIKELQEAASLADSVEDLQEQVNSYQALAEAYDKQGNSQKSMQAYRKFSETLKKSQAENQTKKIEKEYVLQRQQDILSLPRELALDESKYELRRRTSEFRDNQLWFQRLLIYGLLLLLIILAIGSYFIFQNAQRSKRMSQLLALKSLRSQMNPHFIFNALNSVNQFISNNDERAANKFLTEFSKLMRLVLDNSHKDFITLAEEKEIIALYLKLEHYRFRDKFDFELNIDASIQLESIEIPPMLLQPYIENAIWHGLRYKEEKGHLQVDIKHDGAALNIKITDDGIGREKSKELKTINQNKHLSTGLKNTEERIQTINKVYRKNYKISILDLPNSQPGTQVEIILPQNGK